MTFPTYDAMTGPDLDRSLWSDHELNGAPRVEPAAVTTVADGAVTVDIPGSTNGDESVQGLDSTEHLVVSTRSSTLSATGTSEFAVDVLVDPVGMEDDHRLGVTSSDVSGGSAGQVHDVLATEDRVSAEHELLAPDGCTRPHVQVRDGVGAGLSPRPGRRRDVVRHLASRPPDRSPRAPSPPARTSHDDPCDDGVRSPRPPTRRLVISRSPDGQLMPRSCGPAGRPGADLTATTSFSWGTGG